MIRRRPTAKSHPIAGAAHQGEQRCVPRRIATLDSSFDRNNDVRFASNKKVKDARVLRSHGVLDQPAVRAVEQWRYEPLLLNGTPTPFVLTVTVSFSLGR
jgi:TonB family protein